MKLLNFIMGILAIFFQSAAWATPAEVILIRHGEKPASGNELSPQGFARANALPSFFQNNPDALLNGTPAAIYAMGQKPNDPDDSVRAIETVTPLAQALGLTLIENYTREQIQALAQEILNTSAYDGQTVVVCWEHTMIPGIAQDLGVINPPEWDGSVFNLGWIIDFSGSTVTSFKIVNEDVLPGDR